MGCAGGKKKGIIVSDSCQTQVNSTTFPTKKQKKISRKGKEQINVLQIVPQVCSTAIYLYKGEQVLLDKTITQY